MPEREEGKRRFRRSKTPREEEGVPTAGSPPEEAGRQVYPQPQPPPAAPAAAQTSPAAPAPAQQPPAQAPRQVPPPAQPQPPAAAPAAEPPLAEPEAWAPRAETGPPLVTEALPNKVPEPETDWAPEPPMAARPSEATKQPDPPPPPKSEAAPAPPPFSTPGPVQAPAYFYPPPPWYPMPYMPPGFGYPYQQPGAYPGMHPAGAPMEPTGQMPFVAQPGVPFMQPPQIPPSPYQPVQLESLEGEEFVELARPQPSHWRGDLKWTFGIISTILLFLTLAFAGAYRSTGPGAAKQVLTPLIESATEVEQVVKENYQELRSKARKLKNATIVIPDIGVTVSVKAVDINTLNSSDLANRVALEVQRQVYLRGNSGNLPMEAARGAGEERAKAVSATLLSEINKDNHSKLLWPLITCGVLLLAFGILFSVFCNGWGRLIGLAIVFIAASLPASLFIRVNVEFFWKPGAGGLYKSAAQQAYRSIGSLSAVFFDIALGVGALLLLAGIIGSILSKRSRERVPPFVELKRPAEAVAGGAPLEPGLEVTDEAEVAEVAVFQAFEDLQPPPGDAIKNP